MKYLMRGIVLTQRVDNLVRNNNIFQWGYNFVNQISPLSSGPGTEQCVVVKELGGTCLRPIRIEHIALASIYTQLVKAYG